MTLLDPTKSGVLRHDYIRAFVNTTQPYYRKGADQKSMLVGGRYTGYLWDRLLNPSIILEHEADHLLRGKQKIYIMWDMHLFEMILIPNYRRFPEPKILYADIWTEAFKNDLPEDVYIFDDTLNWSIIYTHETDENNNRYCLKTEKLRINRYFLTQKYKRRALDFIPPYKGQPAVHGSGNFLN